MNFLPYTHIFERGWALLSLTQGATMIVNTHPQEVQQSMRETHPTCMSSVPRFWEKVYMGVMDKIEHASTLQRKLFMHALAVGRKHNIEYLSLGKKPPMALHLEYSRWSARNWVLRMPISSPRQVLLSVPTSRNSYIPSVLT